MLDRLQPPRKMLFLPVRLGPLPSVVQRIRDLLQAMHYQIAVVPLQGLVGPPRRC